MSPNQNVPCVKHPHFKSKLQQGKTPIFKLKYPQVKAPKFKSKRTQVKTLNYNQNVFHSNFLFTVSIYISKFGIVYELKRFQVITDYITINKGK